MRMLAVRDGQPGAFGSGNNVLAIWKERHRFREYVDDEKFVFHMILAVVAEDNLAFVHQTDEDCGRSLGLWSRCLARGPRQQPWRTDAHSAIAVVADRLARGLRCHEAIPER
jgi:hypothetical protein